MRDEVMLVFLIFLLSFQAKSPIDAAKLPQMAESVSDFVPAGWTIEAEMSGDLNRDFIPDLAVTLVEQMPANADQENPPERQRALLILLKTTDGKFNRAGLATKLLLCTRCGGAFYGVVETPVNVEIKNGVLIVKQEYGSRELTQETYRFRYEAESGRFLWIGADLRGYDRMTGEAQSESTNFLTGVKLTTRTRTNEKTGKDTVVANQSQRVSRAKKYLEDVVAHENGQEKK